MADELVDWADVAAIGFLAAQLDDVDPLAAAIEWHAADGEDRDRCDDIAAALRSAFEAGFMEGRTQVCREVEAARRLEVDDG